MPIIPAAPPTKRAAVPTAAKTKAAQQNQMERELAQKEAIVQTLQATAGIAAFFKLEKDAVAIAQVAEPLAEGIVEYSRGKDAVQKWLNSVGDAGPLLKLIQPLMQLSLQIGANHNWIDAKSFNQFGVIDPTVLEKQLQDAKNQQYSQAVQEEMESRQEAKRWAAEEARMQAEDDAQRVTDGDTE